MKTSVLINSCLPLLLPLVLAPALASSQSGDVGALLMADKTVVEALSRVKVNEPEIISVQDLESALPWITLVWYDPVNLMSYVTYVFQTYFGYSRAKAEKLMMDVHVKGKAVVSHGTRETMETDCMAMQGFGLWATFEKDQ